MRKSSIIFTLIIGFGFAGVAQEYDDMYFNSNDRKKAKKEREKELEAELAFENSEDYYFEDNYSTNQVDPALIEKYDQQAEEARLQYQSQYNSTNSLINQNSNYSEPLDFQYSTQDYYYDDQYADPGTTIINNYYGNNNPNWYGRYGYNGFYDPWNGWGNGWSVSLGWGYGWNSYWCDPFYGNWGWGWNTAYYNPWGGWYGGWGNSWAWGNPWRRGWYRPYDYGGYYIVQNTPSKRDVRGVTRGSRTSRGGAVVGSSGSNRGSSRTNSVANNNRDFSRAQENYYNRSRSSVGARNSDVRTSRTRTGTGDYSRAGTTRLRSSNNRSSGYSNTERSRYSQGRASGETSRSTLRSTTRPNLENRNSTRSNPTIIRPKSTSRGSSNARSSNSSYSQPRTGRTLNSSGRSNINLNRSSGSSRSNINVNRSNSNSRSSSIRSSSSRSSSSRSSSSSRGSSSRSSSSSNRSKKGR